MISLSAIERDEEWKAQALCRDFTKAEKKKYWVGGKYDEVPERTEQICFSCPVRELCLEEALAYEGKTTADSRYHIYGGLNGKQRAALARQRAEEKKNQRSQRSEPRTLCGGPDCTNLFDPRATSTGNRRSQKGMGRYCSRACAVKATVAARPRTNIRPCANCGHEFDVFLRLDGHRVKYARRFCSEECQREARRGRGADEAAAV